MDYLLLLFAAAAAAGAVLIFNRLPEKWFVDYGEPVPERTGERLKPVPSIIAFAAVLAAAWYFGRIVFPTGRAFFALLFTFICVALSAADLTSGILPDQFVAALAVSAALFSAFDYKRFYLYLLGAVLGGGAIWLMGSAGKLLFKTEAMGFGDVKLAGALGLACGLPGTAYALLISILTGALAAVPLLFVSKDRRRSLPFAPFLCFGAVAAIYFNAQIGGFFKWYISLF